MRGLGFTAAYDWLMIDRSLAGPRPAPALIAPIHRSGPGTMRTPRRFEGRSKRGWAAACGFGFKRLACVISCAAALTAGIDGGPVRAQADGPGASGENAQPIKLNGSAGATGTGIYQNERWGIAQSWITNATDTPQTMRVYLSF